jgi:ATP-dependent helicase IRC3
VRLQLRDYQEDALRRVAAAEARGVRRQLGVAATGLGKTVMFCALAEQRRSRTLVLAHRDELVQQAAAKVREVWPEASVGVVKAQQNDVHADVVVASVQTLARERRLDELCAPWEQPGLLSGRPPFDLVVVDEAHHATAASYVGILERLRAGQPGGDCWVCAAQEAADDGASPSAWPPHEHVISEPGPLLLGVTATPDRGDGKGLDDLFDEVTFSYDLLWGIRAQYLSELRGIRVRVENLDLDGVKVRRGDLDQGQAGRAMEASQTERHVVAAWLEHAMGRRTLVFTPTVEVARLVAEAFTDAGVRAAYVHGGTPTDDRRQMLADYSAGRIEVLANCAVLTEGYDEPRTDCIVVARPTKSRALYAQMVGRGTRRHPDKADCLVLDIVGATDKLSLVTVPSLFGLEGKHAQRMADGTGDLSGVVQERDDELVRLGRMRAEDAQLFKQLRTEGIAWVQVHREGDELRRYVRSLGRDAEGKALPTVVIAQRVPGEDVWTAGLLDADGGKRVLLAEVSMEMAQGVGEDYVRRHAPGHLARADAGWRKGRPSAKALTAAGKWHLAVDPKWNAGELSDALDAHIARIKAKPRKPKATP